MKFKFTGFLLAIAVLALGYFFLVEQPRHRRAVDDQQREKALTTLSLYDVDTLSVERPDVTLVFVRDGDWWWMKRPADDLADRATVNTLLKSIVDAQIERRVEGGTLADYGLDPPAAVVDAHAGANRLTISIGNLNVTRSQCYARTENDGDVILVPAGLRRYALRDVFEWRDKKVLEFAADSVSRITIQSAKAKFDWERAGSKDWFTYVGKDTIRGDKRSLRMVLGELRAMRATDIVDDTPDSRSRYVTPRFGSIAIQLPGGTTETFLFGAKEDASCFVALQGGSRIVQVEADVLDIFERSLEDFRDRNVLHFERGGIVRIAVETETWAGSIRRTGDEWSFANPQMGAIDQRRVSAFLSMLEELKYRRVIEERATNTARYGLDQPTARLSLYDADGRIVDEAATGAAQEQGNVRYATSRSSSLLGIIDAEPLIDIETRFESFKIK